MHIDTFEPIRGMIICLDGGTYVKRSDYEKLQNDLEQYRMLVGTLYRMARDLERYKKQLDAERSNS
jgi:hypothetical protein